MMVVARILRERGVVQTRRLCNESRLVPLDTGRRTGSRINVINYYYHIIKIKKQINNTRSCLMTVVHKPVAGPTSDKKKTG